MITYIKQVLCGLSGHSWMMRFDPPRMFLQCRECLHESHGVDTRREAA